VTEPPELIVREAVRMSTLSPCAKSKRGAITFIPDERPNLCVVLAGGFNGQPEPFKCDASERCRAACGKLCEHAEDRAIRASILEFERVFTCGVDSGIKLDLVHAKTIDGALVAGGHPSCWQCSRTILGCGFIAGVWLYEAKQVHSMHVDEFMVAKAEQAGPLFGVWVRYAAVDFHRVTLENCGLTK
jgi:hypothetical protein